MNFKYAYRVESDEPVMLLDQEIGDGGIDDSVFIKELLQIDELGKRAIQIWINAPGGLVSAGWNIYSVILRTKTKVDTYCVGQAASIAAVIFQAGRKRVIADYGLLMYHNPYKEGGSTVDAQLLTYTDSLVKMIARSGNDETLLKQMLEKETWITADEAMKAGLADEVEKSADFNRKRIINLNGKEHYAAARAVLNKTFRNSEVENSKSTPSLKGDYAKQQQEKAPLDWGKI